MKKLFVVLMSLGLLVGCASKHHQLGEFSQDETRPILITEMDISDYRAADGRRTFSFTFYNTGPEIASGLLVTFSASLENGESAIRTPQGEPADAGIVAFGGGFRPGRDIYATFEPTFPSDELGCFQLNEITITYASGTQVKVGENGLAHYLSDDFKAGDLICPF